MSIAQTQSIILVHSIVCDDIRREDNGKFILIGVYPEVLMLNAIPAQIQLAFWLQYKVLIFAKTKLEFEIRGSAINETVPFSLEVGDEGIYGKNETIPLIIRLPFAIKAPGTLAIYYRILGDKDWQIAQTMTIRRNPVVTTQTMQ